ncbi:MAG: class II glutamine amidotransferase, partial [Muribaculaceae bacterium]|nr:class II glutamine amidotransferase [Muribaculaceae bacterium]
MCGIVGYIGNQQAYPILIKGLERLEYRGYDSAGIALINDNDKLDIYKTQGKVSKLVDFCRDKDVSATIGIAHTRWATHGEPSDINAHPHVDANARIAIVHNGTIENYAILKQALIDHGCTFSSETDTEVLAQLIGYIKATNHCSLQDAVIEALNQVVGAYAIAVIDIDCPDTIIAARKSSPLVIGINPDETIIASDAGPIVEHTSKVVYLNDGEIAVARRNQPLQLIDISTAKPAKIDIKTLQLSLAQLEKGGYPH